MKKTFKNLPVLILAFFLMPSLQAQSLFAVEHAAGGSVFTSTLGAAISEAADGDFIYLPGGVFTINDLVINKRVNLIGAGTNADSSAVTGVTSLIGNLIFVTGANNGSLQGFRIFGNLTFGTDLTNQYVRNYFVSRCQFNELRLSYNGSDTNSTSFTFRECIIRGIIYGGRSHAIFQNNVIEQHLNYFTGAIFDHNIFLYGAFRTVNTYVRNTTFSNNIFKYSCVEYQGNNGCINDPSASAYNSYQKNMFSTALTFSIFDCGGWYGGCFTTPYSPTTLSGNLENVPENMIYVNQSGNTYSIVQNYHLVPASPGKNAGTDGTDLGIYGGSQPFKDGALPVNPHISYKSVAGSTNSGGMLQVHFKVAAQNH